jgi:hypothetical protein
MWRSPRANGFNDVCNVGRNRQASEGAHISPACISFGYQPGRREDCGADNAEQLGSQLLRLALPHRPPEHLPVDPDVLAR